MLKNFLDWNETQLFWLGDPSALANQSCVSFKSQNFFSIGLKHFLNLYHTFPTFHDPGTESFWKHCGRGKKYWLPAFSPFPTMFSILSRTSFNFLFTFVFLSASLFNLGQSKILSCSKDLRMADKYGLWSLFILSSKVDHHDTARPIINSVSPKYWSDRRTKLSIPLSLSWFLNL